MWWRTLECVMNPLAEIQTLAGVRDIEQSMGCLRPLDDNRNNSNAEATFDQNTFDF